MGAGGFELGGGGGLVFGVVWGLGGSGSLGSGRGVCSAWSRESVGVFGGASRARFGAVFELCCAATGVLYSVVV